MREPISEAVFVTADHFIFGKVMTAPRRFSDVLNDPMKSWILLLEAELARPNEPQKIVATFPEMVLAKAYILMAIITQEPLEDDRRRLYTYAHRKPQPLYISVPPYEIEGVGYLDRVGELYTILSVEAREFVPLTEATVVMTPNPDVRLRADVVLLNRRAICGVASSEEVALEGET